MTMQDKIVSTLRGGKIWYDCFGACDFNEVCDVDDIKPIIMNHIYDIVDDIDEIRKGTDNHDYTLPKFVSFLTTKAHEHKLSSSFRREMILFSMLTDSVYKGTYEADDSNLYKSMFCSVVNDEPVTVSSKTKKVFMKKNISEYYKKELDRQNLKLYLQAPKYPMDTIFCFKDCWFSKLELINLHKELLIPCMLIDLVSYYSGMRRDKIDVRTVNNKVAVDFRHFVNVLADELEWSLKIHYANPKLLAIGEIEC